MLASHESLNQAVLKAVDAFDTLESRQVLLDMAVDNNLNETRLLVKVYLNETSDCFKELGSYLKTIKATLYGQAK